MPILLVACLLSGCTSAGPSDPTDTAPSTSATDPTTATTRPAEDPPATTTAHSAEGPPSTTSTPTAPRGTVVPFRPVVLGSASGKRIGLVAAAGSDPFSRAATESVETQLLVAGAELIRCDPGGDATLVLGCASRLAAQHVDGWITVQPGELPEALCAAGPQDVPLIAISDQVNCQTTRVGADNYRAGLLTGTELGRAARFGASCSYDALVIISDEATTSGQIRADGIRAGFANQCPGPITHEIPLDAGTQDRAYEAFTNVLTSLPDDADIVVAAADDGVALGVAAAVPDTRAARVTMAAIGADQRARCQIIANTHWIGDAALFPDRYGEVAVPALLDALQQEQNPPLMYVETLFVTADTLSGYYNVTDCPVL